MKQEEFRRQLAAVTPDMPEHFVQHVDLVLEKIVEQEKTKAAQKVKTVSFMGRLVSKRAMVVIIALINRSSIFMTIKDFQTPLTDGFLTEKQMRSPVCKFPSRKLQKKAKKE